MDPKNSNYFIRLIEKNDSELQYMVNHPEGIKKEAYKVAQYILSERKEAIDYSTYSYDELLESLSWINKEKYPVRLKVLQDEIKNRDFDREVMPFSNTDSPKRPIFSERLNKNPFPSLRLRPDVSFKIQGDSIDQFDVLSEKDFKAKLLNPVGQRDIIVEDSNIRLFIRFDTYKHEYGFKFWYYDKYLKKEYRSILHGISDSFTYDFVSDFIEKGKRELQILTWKEVHVSSIRSAFASFLKILNYGVTGLMILLVIDLNFIRSGISSTFFEFLFSNIVYFFGITLISMILGIIKDWHQLMNLKKLNLNEKIDTLSPIFGLPFFALIMYLMSISEGFK